mmetsp:Transcript_6749/g.24959  ORF Transcript_6749/g.24959 Transcript_6749/m.24959 type:complete len:232 (+) Transcript_6749:51-746(+)
MFGRALQRAVDKVYAAASRTSSRPWETNAFAAKVISRSTTVVCVRKGNEVVIAADGQVTRDSEILKPNVRKVRRLGPDKDVLCGFAGTTADAYALLDRLESKIEEHPRQLTRAAVELAKLWRTDKYLRNLDAVLLIADSSTSLFVSGSGDVLEPHLNCAAVGSGGNVALGAARALLECETSLTAEEIAHKAVGIAADVDVFTSNVILSEKIVASEEDSGAGDEDIAETLNA